MEGEAHEEKSPKMIYIYIYIKTARENIRVFLVRLYSNLVFFHARFRWRLHCVCPTTAHSRATFSSTLLLGLCLPMAA